MSIQVDNALADLLVEIKKLVIVLRELAEIAKKEDQK